jgi:hypothetical protein
VAAEVVAGRISANSAAMSAIFGTGFTRGVWRDGGSLSRAQSQRLQRLFKRFVWWPILN